MTVYCGFAVADAMFSGFYCLIERRELPLEAVKAVVADGVTPCINPAHAATIGAIQQRFGISVPIPETPPHVTLQQGDQLIVMSVRGLPRLTDRHEYTAEEIGRAQFAFHGYRLLAGADDASGPR